MEKDMVNERVYVAQVEIEKRAKRLQEIVARPGKKSAEFQDGVKLLTKMIEQQSQLLEVAVFDEPKTVLEQRRNLMLMTGDMTQSPVDGIKAFTGMADNLLEALDAMSKQR